MSRDVRLIDSNGSYTIHASDNTDYSLLFRNGMICVENELGHCVCEFFADDAPAVDAVEVVHAKWKLDRYATEWTCSNCEGEMLYQVITYGGGQYHDIDNIFPLYCPHCGAKMDLED